MTREEAARIITVILDCCKGKDEDYEKHEIIPLEKSFKALSMAIKALQQEPKRGKWIDYTDEGFVECPFCHSATTCEDNINELKFCFSCGARMESDEE